MSTTKQLFPTLEQSWCGADINHCFKYSELCKFNGKEPAHCPYLCPLLYLVCMCEKFSVEICASSFVAKSICASLISFVYLFIHTAGRGEHDSRATEAAPLLLDLREIFALGRLWWAELKAVHIQDNGVSRPSPVVAYMLLPPLPPHIPVPQGDAEPAAEDHTGACELQLRYVVGCLAVGNPKWYILYISS